MEKEKKLKHPKYYAIKGYQILARKTDQQMADALDITVRTYKNRINGISDFSATDANIMEQLLHVKKDDIFLT